MQIDSKKYDTPTDANNMLVAGVCKITNDKFSWVMQVDGRTILFQGGDNADYFVEVFTKLGYEIVWDKDKWQKEW